MKLALAPLFIAAASASSLTTDSKVGAQIMSKARSLNQNDNLYYSWISKYSIKFDGCASVPQFEKEEGMTSRMLAKFTLCQTDGCNKCQGDYVVEMRELVEAAQVCIRILSMCKIP